MQVAAVTSFDAILLELIKAVLPLQPPLAGAGAARSPSCQGCGVAQSACQSTVAARLPVRAHSSGRKIQILHTIVSTRVSAAKRTGYRLQWGNSRASRRTDEVVERAHLIVLGEDPLGREGV
jgi:hypothetical protein